MTDLADIVDTLGHKTREQAAEIERLRNDNRILTKQVMEAAVRKGQPMTDDLVTRLRDLLHMFDLPMDEAQYGAAWTTIKEAADEITRLKARCEVLERVIHNVEAWHMVPDEDQKT